LFKWDTLEDVGGKSGGTYWENGYKEFAKEDNEDKEEDEGKLSDEEEKEDGGDGEQETDEEDDEGTAEYVTT
jgi:hypothetical protein